jgi:hypothetical protein
MKIRVINPFWRMSHRSYGKYVVGGIVFLLAGALLFACRLPSLNQLNYTRTQPKNADLVGTWVLDKNSMQEMKAKGGYNIPAPTLLTLKNDSTFEFTNVPDPFGETHSKVQNYSGTGNVSRYADNGFWQINFRSNPGIPSAQLIGQGPPYHIEIIIGDPDNSQSMVLIKQ